MKIQCVRAALSYLVIASCLFTPAAFAAEVISGRFNENRPLNFGLVLSGPYKTPQNHELLESALGLVASVPARGFSLQHKPNAEFDFIVEVMDRASARNDLDAIRNQGITPDPKADAHSFALESHPHGPYIVRLFWDQLMTEERAGRRVERVDSFSRLVAALGHEIYGNIVSFRLRAHELDSPAFKKANQGTGAEQIKFEIAAFTTGVEFLERLLAKWGPRIGPKLEQDFKGALEFERKGLDSWRRAQKQVAAASDSPTTERPFVRSLQAARCERLFVPAR